jgi:ABC-type amino acid transport substrate-binding protein
MKKLITLIFAVIISSNLFAQESNHVKVAVDEFPPFSMKDSNGSFSGFDIDLWDAIAKENKWTYELVETANVNGIVAAVKSEKANVGISGITITSDREEKGNFSYPYFDSGLQLMVSNNTLEIDISDKFKAISPILGKTLLIFLIIATFFAHAVWIVERYNQDDDNFAKGYLGGIGQAYWWVIVTATTVGYGDITPKKALGRFLAVFTMVAGIMWFGYFTGSISSMMTILETDVPVESIQDMNGKTIATKEGSTASNYLKTFDNISVVECESIGEACNKASSGEVDGVLFDSPALIRYANSHEDVTLIDGIIEPQKYGIFMKGSNLKEDIDTTLLKFKEDGRYKKIYERWFK